MNKVQPLAGLEDRANPVRFSGRDLLLDCAGAVFDIASQTLIVADLHLEKAQAFASRGQMLPPYEVDETLRRLNALWQVYRPARLVLLGDSFHRIPHLADAEALATLSALNAASELIWIAGNHDPVLPEHVPGKSLPELMLGLICLRHEPAQDGEPEIVGHLHPAARIPTRAGKQRRRCILVATQRIILPAFGALTGSRDIFEAEFSGLFDVASAEVHLVGDRAPHRFPVRALLR